MLGDISRSDTCGKRTVMNPKEVCEHVQFCPKLVFEPVLLLTPIQKQVKIAVDWFQDADAVLYQGDCTPSLAGSFRGG